MISFPHCKINLGLDVLRKRPDGYHDIETVMFPVRDLCDSLDSNIQLVYNNARLAARTACALQTLEQA